MTTVESVRAQFSALQQPLAFFDGPGGTQVPDTVMNAMSSYLREANANTGGPFSTSQRTDDVLHRAHELAGEFLGASGDEVSFGANMTTLNFALSRAASRDWREGDEIVCTVLDHDANVSPWLQIAADRGLVVKFADIDAQCRLDVSSLRSLLSERTRVVAFPWAANSTGTITPVAQIAALAHEADALAWVDAVHYAPHGPIDVRAVGADVLLCSPYKYYGPHLGLAYIRAEVGEAWRPYKVRPAHSRFETGTLAHESLAGFVAAVEYLQGVGWEFVQERELELGAQFLAGLPDGWTLHGVPTMDGRTPTFALTHASVSAEEASTRLGEQGFATWWGNYYAVEIMRRLALDEGALRIGIVHYNTADEVARLLDALASIGS